MLVVLLLLSYGCLVTVNVLWPFLAVPLVGLRCVIVVLPDHNHFFCSAATMSQAYLLKSIDVRLFKIETSNFGL